MGGTLRASITTDMFNYSFKPSMEHKLKLFAEHGFEYIHWCDDWNNGAFYTEREIKEYRQLIDSAGLKCLDIHGTSTKTIRMDSEEKALLDEYIRLLENRVRFCAEVGGDAVVVHPPGDKTDEDLRRSLNRSLEVFERVRRLCEDLGVVIAVENGFPADREIFNFYFERYPPEFVGFCYDSGHANIQKNLDQLMGFGSRLRVLHLNDNRGEKDDHQPPFWGTVDWERVMLWIKEINYTKPPNFEITHRAEHFKGDMEEYLEYTAKAVKRVLKLLE